MLKLARSALLAAGTALLALAAAPAHAQEVYGDDIQPKNYIFFGGGVTAGGKLNAKNVSTPGQFFNNIGQSLGEDNDSPSLGTGWQAFGGLGASNVFFPGLRLEAEGLFGNNDLEDADAIEVRTLGGLGDAIYQFKIWRIQPYAGGGVGYGRTKVQYDPNDDIGFDNNDVQIRDGGLIWQIKAGLAFPLNRRTTLDLGYRYLNGANIDNASVTNPITHAITTAEIDPGVHAINAGIRIALGGVRRGQDY